MLGITTLEARGAFPVEIRPRNSLDHRVRQVKDGGVLSVAEGATATLMSTSNFTDGSVTGNDLGRTYTMWRRVLPDGPWADLYRQDRR